jgi:hypothetical protein
VKSLRKRYVALIAVFVALIVTDLAAVVDDLNVMQGLRSAADEPDFHAAFPAHNAGIGLTQAALLPWCSCIASPQYKRVHWVERTIRLSDVHAGVHSTHRPNS